MSGVNYFLMGIIFTIASSYFLLCTGALITDPLEVGAIKSIKSSLVDPMNKLSSWNFGDPCTSNWTGIFCPAMPNDEYLHIQEIRCLSLNLSGTLSTQLGLLSHLKIINFMWNNISGTIPKEIGNITSLKLLLLNGNQLSGSIPDELGNLVNLTRLQIDQNYISGAIPKSFSNLHSVKHLHLDNNLISGTLPPELSRLPKLGHLALNNNNLSGQLPPEFSSLPNLKILQLDNNNFSGSMIPASYGKLTALLKLSIRNCSLEGAIPDLSGVLQLRYLDLSANQLKGPIHLKQRFINITTINLSSNLLNGTIPSSFTALPKLQLLSLKNNFLSGSVPSIWQSMTFSMNQTLIVDFQNNSLMDISDSDAPNPPANVKLLLYGNPICNNADQAILIKFCQSQNVIPASGITMSRNIPCSPCPADKSYEYNPFSPIPCFCAVPIGVGLRLKSPEISYFPPYIDDFKTDVTSLLSLYLYQLYFDLYIWENGPRLNMNLKLFPSNTSLFNISEVLRLESKFSGFEITLSDIFGPYELLNFTLGSYADEIPIAYDESRNSKVPLVYIFLVLITSAVILAICVMGVIIKKYIKYWLLSTKRSSSKISKKISDLKSFTIEEMKRATTNFNDTVEVGRGGYGKVYKGILDDGTLVAIKRAQVGSLQGSKEFRAEIEMLSRIHHRNLVSLVGYCDDDDEQMLVYEFMQNGTLREHLFAKRKESLTVSERLRIALETARGILYLHTDADPPIFHRDIKSSNILLDSKFVAKVADFGLSRLAPTENIEGIVPDHISTGVKGTPGYLDPEYLLTNKLTDKSDVYSLGVVFLELLTGMHPVSFGKNIVREVSRLYRSGKAFSIIDTRMGAYPSECIHDFLFLALKCCLDDPNARPSMREVVRELEIICNSMMLETDTFSESTESETSVISKQTCSSSSVPTYPYVPASSSFGNQSSNTFASVSPDSVEYF